MWMSFLQYFDSVIFLLVVKFAWCFLLCDMHFSKATLAQHTNESKTMSVTQSCTYWSTTV